MTRKLADLENNINKLEKSYIQYVELVQRDSGKQYIPYGLKKTVVW